MTGTQKPSKYGFHMLTDIGDSLNLDTPTLADVKRVGAAARNYAEVRDWGLSLKKLGGGLTSVTRVR